MEGAKSGVELNIMSLMHVPNFIEIGPLVNKWPNYFHKFCDLSHCAAVLPCRCLVCIFFTFPDLHFSNLSTPDTIYGQYLFY